MITITLDKLIKIHMIKNNTIELMKIFSKLHYITFINNC